jgi:hypothetical protein
LTKNGQFLRTGISRSSASSLSVPSQCPMSCGRASAVGGLRDIRLRGSLCKASSKARSLRFRYRPAGHQRRAGGGRCPRRGRLRPAPRLPQQQRRIVDLHPERPASGRSVQVVRAAGRDDLRVVAEHEGTEPGTARGQVDVPARIAAGQGVGEHETADAAEAHLALGGDQPGKPLDHCRDELGEADAVARAFGAASAGSSRRARRPGGAVARS